MKNTLRYFSAFVFILLLLLLLIYAPVIWISWILKHQDITTLLRWLSEVNGVQIASHYPNFWWWLWLAGQTYNVTAQFITFLFTVFLCSVFCVSIVLFIIGFNRWYYSNVHKKVILALTSLLLTVTLIFIVLVLGEIYLRTRIQVGLLTDDVQMVDSVIDYKCHLSDSFGINRLCKECYTGVNADGFISNFNYDTATANSFRSNRKKIAFVVGDSFVEGASNSGIDSSFTKILQNELADYAVYNFGVGGSNPVNYSLILEQYVPILKPDVVLLVFCSNDDMPEDLSPLPDIPYYFHTNYNSSRGRLTSSRQPDPDSSCSYKQFNNAKDLYDFLMQKYSYKRLSNPWLQTCMKHSALFTQLVRARYKLPAYNELCPEIEWGHSYAYKHLKASYQVCSNYKALFKMIYVPYVGNSYLSYQDYENLPELIFKDLKTITTYPVGFTSKDYMSREDGHFNDQGNRKFAELCKKLILNEPLEKFPDVRR